MKAFFSFVAVAAVSFFFGCSTFSPNAVDNQSSSIGKVVSFTVNFNDEQASLAKKTESDDGLVIKDRKDLLAYEKARITKMTIQLKKIRWVDDSVVNMTKPEYVYEFPVKDGICSGEFKVDSGCYFVECYDNGKIKAGPDSMTTFDFQGQTRVSIGATDTTNINILLYKNYYLPVVIKFTCSGVSFNGFLDSIWGQGVIGSGAGRPKVTNGYLEPISVFSVKKDFYFYLNEKKYFGLFDVTKAMDDNVVEVAVVEVKQSIVNASISFDNSPFTVITRFPKAGDTLSVSAPYNITVCFNRNVASISEMPNLVFTVEEVPDSVKEITVSTSGTLVKCYSPSANHNTMSIGAEMKIGKRYICRISKVVDEYGNVLAEGANWMFYTKE